MSIKIHTWDPPNAPLKQYFFHCPGCNSLHGFTVEPSKPDNHPRWTFNGSFNKPTFHPSLLCNKDFPESRCHLFVTDGKIIFQNDCWHNLKNQTIEIPDWEN